VYLTIDLIPPYQVLVTATNPAAEIKNKSKTTKNFTEVFFATMPRQFNCHETISIRLPRLAKTIIEVNSRDNFVCNQILDLMKNIGE
jgi:hypothetical protein